MQIRVSAFEAVVRYCTGWITALGQYGSLRVSNSPDQAICNLEK